MEATQFDHALVQPFAKYSRTFAPCLHLAVAGYGEGFFVLCLPCRFGELGEPGYVECPLTIMM